MMVSLAEVLEREATAQPVTPVQQPFDFDAPAPARVVVAVPVAFEPPTIIEEIPVSEPFGVWLLQQKDRKGWIGDLAKGARQDPAFPKRGSIEEVRKRLEKMGADGDVFEALDDAEMEWLSL